MNAHELQDLLRDVLEEIMFARDDEDSELAELAENIGEIESIASYDDVGMLTTGKGHHNIAVMFVEVSGHDRGPCAGCRSRAA